MNLSIVDEKAKYRKNWSSSSKLPVWWGQNTFKEKLGFILILEGVEVRVWRNMGTWIPSQKKKNDTAKASRSSKTSHSWQALQHNTSRSIDNIWHDSHISIQGKYFKIQDSSWPVFLTVVYVLGGTYGHTLHCLIHDFTHFGGHKDMTINKIMAVLCNIPMGFPSALSFGKHHADHHNYLGEQGRDPDLPTRI